MSEIFDSDYLVQSFKNMNINLSSKQVNQFVDYYNLLIEWNSFMNLTSITKWEDVVIKHFVDSVSLSMFSKEMTQASVSLIDVGTGAGFPGVPLKIVFPQIKITLLDSLKKRIGFLDEVVSSLCLSDVSTIHGRAEDIGRMKEHREQYDFCVSRAVANLSTLSEICLPFVKVGGQFISYKSEKADEEVVSSSNAIKLLGGNLKSVEKFVLSGSEFNRAFVFIDKVEKVSNRFPRKAGTPGKEPL